MFWMLTQESQIFEQIKKANTILVTYSRSERGDGIASALAMYLYLKKLGKTVDIVAEDDGHSKQLAFLPGSPDIKRKLENLRRFIISLDIRHTKVGQIQYKVESESLNFIVSPIDGFFTKEDISTKSSGFKYDLIITLGAHDLESLGQIYDHDTEFFYQTTIINIDHLPSNESFGQINLVDINSVATAEILFNLFNNHNQSYIDEDIATCLLAGLIIATKSFKTSNISPNVLSVASQLVGIGARREEIVNHLYRSRSLNLLKLWGIVLARLTASTDNKIISSIINNEDFTKTKTSDDDLLEVIDELIVNIPQAKIISLVYEHVKDEVKSCKAIVYGVKNLDVLSILSVMNPTGQKSLAHLVSDKPLKEFEKELTQVLTEKIITLEI